MNRANIAAWWSEYRFHTILFVSGCAVLIVEVAATRIISPYYGNTVYTVSSVIGVTLFALSLGYAKGGKEGAAMTDIRGFAAAVFHSGVSLLGLFFIMVMILPYGGYLFSLRSGPIIWSLVLFFLPSYFMGKLTPIAVSLSVKQQGRDAGAVVGSLFFWSTAGSILGAIGTGFVLIPYLGIKTIMFLVTTIMLVIGGLGRSYHAPEKEKVRTLTDLVFLLLITMIIYGFGQYYRTIGARFIHDGTYERLMVVDSVTSDGRPTRLLLQDMTTSSGMYIEDPTTSLYSYTDYMRLYKLHHHRLDNALFIGAGAYTMPKLLHREQPSTTIDVVDIEPGMEKLAQTYFTLPDTPKIRTYTEDGRMFLAHSTKSYDLIFSDVYYTMNSVPAHVTTKEFLNIANARLSPRGIFLANIIGSSKEFPESMLYAEIHTMHSVFPFVSVFAVESATSTHMQNFILAGSNVPIETAGGTYNVSSDEDPSQVRAFADNLRVSSDKYSQYPILTDDFAPTEYMAATLMRHYYDVDRI